MRTLGGPLVRLVPFAPRPVPRCLSDPISDRVGLSPAFMARLVSALARLESVAVSAGARETRQSRFDSLVDRCLSPLALQWARATANTDSTTGQGSFVPDLASHLADTGGLPHVFPGTFERLLGGRPLPRPQGKVVTLRDYLKVTTALNQVSGMVTQLSADATADTHKYMAHQVALLYQSLAYLNTGTAAPLRKRVESRFDEIKERIEDSGVHSLTGEQKEWLLRLCADVRGYITQVPPSIQRRLGVVTNHLER